MIDNFIQINLFKNFVSDLLFKLQANISVLKSVWIFGKDVKNNRIRTLTPIMSPLAIAVTFIVSENLTDNILYNLLFTTFL